MARSERLRVGEVRAAVRLAWECCDLGDDPDAWPARLADGLTRLVGAVSLMFVDYAPRVGVRGFVPARVLGFGGPLVERAALFLEYARRPDLPEHLALSRFLAIPKPVAVRAGRDLQPDAEWEADGYRHELLLPAGLDDGMIARGPAGGGTDVGYGPIRAAGEPRFGRRERALLRLVHAELVPHLGRRLATSADPVARLTPRQREVLDCLLEGDGEKQAAARLGVTPATVHEHVKRIHRALGVASRAELLAYFLRRHRRRPEST